MGAKKTTEAIATKRATEIAELYLAKFNNLLNTTAQSNVGVVEEITGPNQFKVRINGEVKDITYTGFRPISADGKIIVNGDFGT